MRKKDRWIIYENGKAPVALEEKMTQEESKHQSKVSVTISPSVLFSIGEIYQRRTEVGPTRIVGALFGSSQMGSGSSGQILINQCFVVPHSEVADQISINSEYYKQRTELHKKCYGNQSVIVGWFSVSQESAPVSEKNTIFIGESFGREVAVSGNSCLSAHLDLVISANGIIKKTVSIANMSTKSSQSDVPHIVLFKSNETFAVHSILNADADKNIITIPSDAEFISNSIASLKEEMAKLQAFQSKIKTGEVKVDASVASAIEANLANFQELTGPKSKARLEADIAALRGACETVKSQLQILEDMVTYQP